MRLPELMPWAVRERTGKAVRHQTWQDMGDHDTTLGSLSKEWREYMDGLPLYRFLLSEKSQQRQLGRSGDEGECGILFLYTSV